VDTNDTLRAVFRCVGRSEEFCLVPNAFDARLFSEDDLLEVLRAMSSVPSNQVKIRVYVDGGLRHDYEARVLRSPPAIDERLETWVTRIFAGASFGIAINSAEQFNDALATRFARLFARDVDVWAQAAGGVDMVFFIGNYGYTPFGIHHDGDDSTILHFHRGPGDKTLMFWKPEEFVRLTGSRESHFRPADLLGTANNFRLTPNSAFYMPPGQYHIGNNPDLSVDLTLGFSRISQSEIRRRAATDEIGRYLIPAADEKKGSLSGVVDNPLLMEFVEDSIEDFRLGFLSNCGYSTPPVPDGLVPNVTTADTVSACPPFKLYHRISSDKKLRIFARRNRIVVNYRKGLQAVVEALNREALPVEKLLDLASCDLHSDAVLRFLNLLSAHRAIYTVRD